MSDQIIFETFSPISGKIKVVDLRGVRQLFVDDVKQSIWSENPSDFLRTYWNASATLPVEDPEKPLHILMCGLGGGTIVKLLQQRYPNLQFTILELDPDIISIAEKYFGIQQNQNLQIINTDATEWLQKNKDNKHQFDVVYLDAYLADIFKIEYAKNLDLMTTICSFLKDDGIFVTNHIIYTEDYNKEIEQHTAFIGKYFSEIHVNIIARYTPADNIVIKAQYPTR